MRPPFELRVPSKRTLSSACRKAHSSGQEPYSRYPGIWYRRKQPLPTPRRPMQAMPYCVLSELSGIWWEVSLKEVAGYLERMEFEDTPSVTSLNIIFSFFFSPFLSSLPVFFLSSLQ